MQRVLKCDGVFPTKMNAQGKFVEITPADFSEMKAYITANRILDTPFDFVLEGRTSGLGRQQVQEKLGAWKAGGMTWWVESTWMDKEEQFTARIRQGPPSLG
jgi:hypothetical protein